MDGGAAEIKFHSPDDYSSLCFCVWTPSVSFVIRPVTVKAGLGHPKDLESAGRCFRYK